VPRNPLQVCSSDDHGGVVGGGAALALLPAHGEVGHGDHHEYQMLWHHFAHQHETVDAASLYASGSYPLRQIQNCCLKPVPNPSKEALFDASSIAKVSLCVFRMHDCDRTILGRGSLSGST
jgi:hypothetical protein